MLALLPFIMIETRGNVFQRVSFGTRNSRCLLKSQFDVLDPLARKGLNESNLPKEFSCYE